MSKIHKACKGYEHWKSKHNPHLKPWLFPEQMDLPRLNMSDIQEMQDAVSIESLDESGVTEADIKDDDLDIWSQNRDKHRTGLTLLQLSYIEKISLLP